MDKIILDKIALSEVLDIPGMRLAIKNNDFDGAFGLCKHAQQRAVLAMGLTGAGIDFLKYMKEIRPAMFRYASTITSIIIPGNIKKIGDFAFFGSSLQSVQLEPGVEEIGDGAFAQTDVKEINLPSSIKSLGEMSLGKAKAICDWPKEETKEKVTSDGTLVVPTINAMISVSGEVIKLRGTEIGDYQILI